VALLSLLAALTAGDVASSASAPTNDAKYGDQWGLQEVGAQYSWSKSTGTGVLIAVVDTGVDFSHPDLAGQIVPGRDFVSGDDDARDETGHGTLIAGIAAAASNNRIGIASVAPGAQILPVRVLANGGTGRPADTAAGIRWAVDTARARGQRLVVNLSLDWRPDPVDTDLIKDLVPLNFVRDPVIDAAIRYAAGAGAVVVVAAGNEGKGQTPYDATTPGVLVVGASDRSDQRASFSNFGQGLDLLAPGTEILSTYWTPGAGSTYGVAKGTSFAVPFVSGTAALLMANGLSNTDAANTILNTARDLGGPGWDMQTGRGLLDAAAAVGAARTAAAAPPAGPHAAATPVAPWPAPAENVAPAGPPPAPAPPVPSAGPPAALVPAPERSPTPSSIPSLPTPLAAELASQNGPQVPARSRAGVVVLAAGLAFVIIALHGARTALRAIRHGTPDAVRTLASPRRRAHGPAGRSYRAPLR
jgi:subtilisin family serine protease